MRWKRKTISQEDDIQQVDNAELRTIGLLVSWEFLHMLVGFLCLLLNWYINGHEFEQTQEGGEDRETWSAVVHGVTKRLTQLSD